MKTHFDRLWQALDILFVTGLAAAMFLGGKVTPLLLVVGVLPIPFLLHALKGRILPVPLWTVVAPSTLYFAYALLVLFWFTGLTPSDPRPVNPSLEYYAVAIAMLGVGIVRGLQVRHLAYLFHRLMPLLLGGCFLLLTVLMFAEIRDACRVRGLAPWPFIPALLFSTLALLSLVGWERMNRRERLARIVILALSVVVSTTYTGSRGVAVAQVFVFSLFCLLNFLPSLQGKIPSCSQLLSAGFSGLALSLVLGIATGCGPVSRFASTFETLETMASRLVTSDLPTREGVTGSSSEQKTNDAANHEALAPLVETTTDEAIAHRLAMWQTSVAAIWEKPVFGHGSLYLQKLIGATYGYEHNHNQYLTWLVTGGIVQLTLGLFFLAIPWFVSLGLTLADRLLLTLAVSVLWGIAMMFDSFLSLKFYTHYYCLLCGILFAWCNSMREAAEA